MSHKISGRRKSAKSSSGSSNTEVKTEAPATTVSAVDSTIPAAPVTVPAPIAGSVPSPTYMGPSFAISLGTAKPKAAPRIPVEYDGIQVNFCKNPACQNFGVPPLEVPKYARRPKVPVPGSEYTITGAHTGATALSCKLCGEYPTLKSNKGIAEELARIAGPLSERPEPSCPEETCGNHGIPVSKGTAYYYSFGKSDIGSKRYKCRCCGKTFSVGKSTSRQRLAHKNKEVFMALMNKVPFNRICEMVGISSPTLYNKIDFIREQCNTFIADREKKLWQGKRYEKLYIAVDRQEYPVNWTERADKRNIVLGAVGSADLVITP